MKSDTAKLTGNLLLTLPVCHSFRLGQVRSMGLEQADTALFLARASSFIQDRDVGVGEGEKRVLAMICMMKE